MWSVPSPHILSEELRKKELAGNTISSYDLAIVLYSVFGRFLLHILIKDCPCFKKPFLELY